jgi:hypothetical protein
MGYQTDFQLTFDATDDVVAEVFSALKKSVAIVLTTGICMVPSGTIMTGT